MTLRRPSGFHERIEHASETQALKIVYIARRKLGHSLAHERHAEPWRVTLVDTGQETLTGGRLKRVQRYVGEDTFCFTYGDGVTDLDIAASIRFHRTHGRQATVTAIQPPGRYGSLNLDGAEAVSYTHLTLPTNREV